MDAKTKGLEVRIVPSMDAFITEEGSDPKNRFICPDSSFTDVLASRGVRAGVETVGDFMRGHTDSVLSEGGAVIKEGELMLSLASAFRRFCPGLQKEYFFHSFALFRELRSFDLDFDNFGGCLDLFDASVAKAVGVFWHYMDETGVVDEHEMCRRTVAHYQGEGDPSGGRRFVLVGFNHLTAHQIDLFKALGLKNSVVAAVSGHVYEESLDTDWFRWFDTDCRKSSVAVGSRREVAIVYYPKDRLAETLARFCPAGRGFDDILLCRKNPGFHHFNEAAIGDASFEYREDVFGPLVDEIFCHIKRRFLLRDASVEAGRLAQYLAGRIEDYIEKRDFRRIKVASLLAAQLGGWRELSADNVRVGDLEVEVFRQIVELRLPKNYGRKIGGGPRVHGMGGVLVLEGKSLVVAGPDTGFLAGVNEGRDHKLAGLLGAIGPIRRGALEAASFKGDLLGVLAKETTVLFMEEGLDEEDPFWSQLAECIVYRKLPLPSASKRERMDVLKDGEKKAYTGGYSATKIQHYRDCPRKFYYGFVEPLRSRARASDAIEPSSLGKIEHKVIGAFVGGGGKLKEVVERELGDHLKREAITLGPADYHRAFNEIFFYSKNGIDYIEQICKKFSVSDFQFEKRIEDGQFTGSADFVAESPSGSIVLDFKRSSIPLKTDLKELKDIQIFFYIHHLALRPERIALAGFFCLSEPDKSLLIEGDDFFIEALERYPSFEAEKIGQIRAEREFAAEPSNSGVCGYCVVRHVCPRGPLR